MYGGGKGVVQGLRTLLPRGACQNERVFISTHRADRLSNGRAIRSYGPLSCYCFTRSHYSVLACSFSDRKDAELASERRF